MVSLKVVGCSSRGGDYSSSALPTCTRNYFHDVFCLHEVTFTRRSPTSLFACPSYKLLNASEKPCQFFCKIAIYFVFNFPQSRCLVLFNYFQVLVAFSQPRPIIIVCFPFPGADRNFFLSLVVSF